MYIKIAPLMDKGSENNQVQEEIERFRNYINTNFYTCTLEIFRGL
ncbi:TipAS antibiotic-recognition domain-containing protein [Clostridium lundense]